MAAEVIATATGDLGVCETKCTIQRCSLGRADKGALKELSSREKPGDTAENWRMVILKAPATELLKVQHRKI